MGYKDLKFEKDTKFLVTGGAGFIGSNLVEAIIKLGYKVRVLDNFSTGKMENLAEFMNNENFELMKGDMRNIETCQSACEGIDYVLNQGALGSVPKSIENPLENNEINVNGTLNMMIASRDNNVKKFIYASSSSVYGDDPNLSKYEGIEGNLLSPYAVTKKIDEMYAKNFYDLFGLKTVGLRYFNVFGKRQDPDSIYSAVIPIFVKKLIKNEPPTIYGDGKQTRDFTFIENVIEANLKSCLAPKEAFGEVFNIAYGEQADLIVLYDKLCALLGKEIRPNFGIERQGDIKHSNADISKAKKILGYDPDYNMNQGLEMTIDWYVKNIN